MCFRTFYFDLENNVLDGELQCWFVNTMMYAHYIFVICLFLTQSKLSLLLVLYTMVVLTVASVTSFSDKNRRL